MASLDAKFEAKNKTGGEEGVSRLLDEARSHAFQHGEHNHSMNGPAAAGAEKAPPAAKDAAERAPVQKEASAEKKNVVSDAVLPAISPSKVKEVKWTSHHDIVDIAPGVKIQSWNFDGKVPGPVLAVNQGDEIRFQLANDSDMPHSIDFHSARTAPNKNYRQLDPGEKLSFNWKAEDPGAFMYHCGTPMALHHMAMGMYGAVIVKPKDLPKADKEFVLVQSEFYPTKPDKEGVRYTDIDNALVGKPEYVTFNGYADKYKDHPLEVKVGEKVRMWVVNAGPAHDSAFHVVGTIFDAAYPDGNPKNKLVGMQTINIPPGGGAMVEFRLREPGEYPFVTHSFGDASKGALGIIKATK